MVRACASDSLCVRQFCWAQGSGPEVSVTAALAGPQYLAKGWPVLSAANTTHLAPAVPSQAFVYQPFRAPMTPPPSDATDYFMDDFGALATGRILAQDYPQAVIHPADEPQDQQVVLGRPAATALARVTHWFMRLFAVLFCAP